MKQMVIILTWAVYWGMSRLRRLLDYLRNPAKLVSQTDVDSVVDVVYINLGGLLGHVQEWEGL
jgi:hypothetical protein